MKLYRLFVTFVKKVIFMGPRKLYRVFAKSENVVTNEVGDECIIVPISDDIVDMDNVFTLNETGAFFWSLIDGKRTIAVIVVKVTEEYDVDKETATKDVLAFLAEMEEWVYEV